MHSCIYEGWVQHRRRAPVAHGFRYRLFMMYLDLEELPSLFDGRWLWSASRRAAARFRREDHLGPADQPLDQAVRELVEKRTGARPAGPVRLLTHLSYFGYRFNPVSFYYCFDAAGQQVQAVVAEVSNTPWGERHCYVVTPPAGTGDLHRARFEFAKEFHVSPFMAMDQTYAWRLTAPGPKLAVHMENYQDGAPQFDASLHLSRTEITTGSLHRVLVQYPLMTVQVIAAIHWQALRLWLKRCPYVPHPTHNRAEVTP
ncbi:MAG: DUF1365 domain-containing protein [Gemmatimonadota bacterium]